MKACILAKPLQIFFSFVPRFFLFTVLQDVYLSDIQIFFSVLYIFMSGHAQLSALFCSLSLFSNCQVQVDQQITIVPLATV